VADKIPLKFKYDGTTPSALGEFTSEDTVSVSNGGTGVSALSSLALSLSATNVSANTVSSLNYFVPDGGAFNCMGLDGQKFLMKRENGATYENLIKSDEGTITIQSEDDIHFLSNTGEKFMRLNESGGNGEVELYYNNGLKVETVNAGINVSGTVANSTSSITVSSCPVPPPFAYAKLDDDGTAATGETNIGAGATITQLTSNNSADILWDDSNDYFTVKKVGVYELTARVVLEVAATTVVTLKIKTGSTVHNTFAPKINSAVDPQEATLHAVFEASADDNISVTHQDDAATNVNAGAGTTLMIKRLY